MQAQAPQFARDYIYGPGGRLAVTIEPDVYGPGGPSGLSGYAASCMSVQLSWSASTDIGSGVGGYNIYVNSSYFDSTSGTSFLASFIPNGTWVNFDVYAYDNVGNQGAASSSTSVFVPECEIGFIQGRLRIWKASKASRFSDFHLVDLALPEDPRRNSHSRFSHVRLLDEVPKPISVPLQAAFAGGAL